MGQRCCCTEDVKEGRMALVSCNTAYDTVGGITPLVCWQSSVYNDRGSSLPVLRVASPQRRHPLLGLHMMMIPLGSPSL